MKIKALSVEEGKGARVRRLFPQPSFAHLDPFVLWDDFSLEEGAGFPWHSHRGFEAITFLFEGALEHEDDLDNHSIVRADGAQRFTAGSGIVHSEMPRTDKVRGIQLWINLPRRLKAMAPSYQQVDELPLERFPGGQRRIIAGEGSPLVLQTPLSYAALFLENGASVREKGPEEFAGIVYVAEGKAEVNGEPLEEREGMLMIEGETLAMAALIPSVLMVCFGRPHGEPIFQRGPFVD